MNWLARLKKSDCVPELHPTKPTEPGFVGFVAPIPEPFQKSGGDRGQLTDTPESAANDTAAPWRVSVAPGTPPDALARLRAASLALDKVQAAIPHGAEAWHERAAIAEFDGGLSRQDAEALADLVCWPHSDAMNGAELDTFTARLARFTDRGLILADAEALADKLVIRDREGDDRRVCLECPHLHHGGRCGNWQAAGVAMRARDAQLSGDFTAMLQRCDGYQSAINSSIQSIG